MELEIKKFFDIPEIFYFQSGNYYTGSKGKMRFSIKSKDEMTLDIWYEDICRELAEPKYTEQFPLTEEGLDALLIYLKEHLNG